MKEEQDSVVSDENDLLYLSIYLFIFFFAFVIFSDNPISFSLTLVAQLKLISVRDLALLQLVCPHLDKESIQLFFWRSWKSFGKQVE